MSVSSITAEQVFPGTIRITVGAGENQITLQASQDGEYWSDLATMTADGGTYDHGGLYPGDYYYYRASDDAGQSGNYASCSASIAPVPGICGIGCSVSDPAKITISVPQPDYATTVQISRLDPIDSSVVVVFTGPANVGSIEDTTAKIGRQYNYSAQAFNITGGGTTFGANGCRPLTAANSPDPADVRDGTPCLSADLLSITTGTLPAAQEPGDEYVLKADVVAAANVLLDVPRWAGATGADKGTVRLPGEARVEDDYDYGPSDSMQGTLVPAPGPAPDDAWAIPKKAIWTEQLKSMPLMVYQHARFRFLFTLVDGEDAPINVDGKLCSFVVFAAAGAAVYQIDGLPVTANTIYVSGADTRTATAATHNWVLRNDTDDVVLARGTIVVQPAADSTP